MTWEEGGGGEGCLGRGFIVSFFVGFIVGVRIFSTAEIQGTWRLSDTVERARRSPDLTFNFKHSTLSSEACTLNPETNHPPGVVHQAVKKLGRQWRKVASEVRTRTAAQCRERFVNVLDPELKTEVGGLGFRGWVSGVMGVGECGHISCHYPRSP